MEPEVKVEEEVVATPEVTVEETAAPVEAPAEEVTSDVAA